VVAEVTVSVTVVLWVNVKVVVENEVTYEIETQVVDAVSVV
jgi:hypothetical protein